MLREIVEQSQYERIRQPLKRKAVHTIRTLVDAVPELGDVGTFLRTDRKAHDAVYTLNAMSFKPHMIARFVDRDRFDAEVVLEILAAAASLKILNLLRSVH